jgi:hypothetical protein
LSHAKAGVQLIPEVCLALKSIKLDQMLVDPIKHALPIASMLVINKSKQK